MYETFGRSFTYTDKLYQNVEQQIQFGERVVLSDDEALELLQKLHPMNGMLYVITDYCYEKKCGPFIVGADQMDAFVKGFFYAYGEAWYSTDIIAVSFTERLIWVLFHEGICWLSKG